MSKTLLRLSLLSILAGAHTAGAEPWLCSDADGVKSFSYEPDSARNSRCVDHPIPSGNVWRKRGAEAPTPETFPRIDAKSQKQRDLARRQILERELAEEQKSLAKAMRELADYQQARAASPRVSAPADLRTYEDRIRVHQANIANLNKELGREG